ncbi:hypothetical protein [Clostridium botulinum]|uniref:hypothetical protein n=1 Tax=Clostridium botulinum TaxID=1491 RepID=UPI001E65AADC|nr:hypothetical protein [Clostridium botulinum]
MSYSKEYGSYIYDIQFGSDNEIAELMQVLYIIRILSLEVVNEWADMILLKNELKLQKSKNFKTAVSPIIP